MVNSVLPGMDANICEMCQIDSTDKTHISNI